MGEATQKYQAYQSPIRYSALKTMMHDFPFILSWWWLLFVVGGALLPLTTAFFSAFRDKGYIFSKILSLAVLSYVSFVLGTVHLVPFGQIPLIVILLALYLINYWFLRPWKSLFTKGFLGIVLVEEALFLLIMSFWTFIRGFNPEVHGLEKYMDFGFMNSILRSTYFPPKDMWLTPYSINYYYFGHLYSAVLMKISGIPPATAFNLIVGMVAGLSFTACFSLGLNLLTPLKFRFRPLKLLLGGLLSAFLVTFAGNLHTIYMFFKPYENDHPVPPWQLQFSPSTFPNSYWYPNATRFIYNTIHEFPIYSWVVSDLHGHVLDIPFVLFTLALLYAFLLRSNTPTHIKQGKHVSHHTTESSWSLRINRPSIKKYIAQPSLWYLVLTGFFLAVMYMTNAWDGLIYLLLTGLVVLVLSSQPIWSKQETLPLKFRSLFSPEVMLPTISSLIPVLAGFIIFSLPFSLFFKPFVSGIGILCAPSFLTKMGHLGPFLFEPNHCQKSPWWQLLILYGFFTFFSASLLIFLRNKEKTVSDKFVLMLIGLSYVLIIIPEFIYVKDIYPEHYRANTMFKLVFQSFIMLSLVSSYTIIRTVSGIRYKILHLPSKLLAIGYLLFTLLLLVLVFIYPYFAITSYYNNLQSYLGIDGMAYLKNLYPTDFAAIQWLNTHVKGQPVILEAQGDSYTDYARVSANTGLPTVLGWTVHEWLWRGEYDYAPDDPKRNTDKTPYYPAPRIADVQTLYESTDLSATTGLLRKYNVQYVFLGDLERQKYANLNEDKWKMFGKVVYQDGQTKIYKLNLQ